MSDTSEKRKAAERRASEILFGDDEFAGRQSIDRNLLFIDNNNPRGEITFNQLVDAILSGERT